MTIITLTTDFGGHYVGIMKGVIKSASPSADIIELSSEVDPFDLIGGAFVLRSSYSYFPRGSIHVAVVDPGVGSERKAIVVSTSNFTFIGPDNGVLIPAAEDDGIVEVFEIVGRSILPSDPSRTFHGRDIFAPSAAYIANGGKPEDFCVAMKGFRRIEFKKSVTGSSVSGEVIHVDRFGNLTLSLRGDDISLGGRLEINFSGERHSARGVGTYAEGGEGLLVLIGSAGFYEVAVKNGSARGLTGAKVGDAFTISKARPD